VSGPVVV